MSRRKQDMSHIQQTKFIVKIAGRSLRYKCSMCYMNYDGETFLVRNRLIVCPACSNSTQTS